LPTHHTRIAVARRIFIADLVSDNAAACGTIDARLLMKFTRTGFVGTTLLQKYHSEEEVAQCQ